ncbi:MAG: glycosyltransferase [Chloroflexi bacterium]|nr:glycosyltransferase [Chloroflexota bacterium]
MQGLACAIPALLPSAPDGPYPERGLHPAGPGARPRRIAVISVHGCPLLPAGGRETGGMNIYLRELSKALAHRGLALDIYTRWHDYADLPLVELAPGVRVIHLEAGARGPLPKEEVYPYLSEFLCNLAAFREAQGLEYDLVHSHYWLSGWVGHFLRRRWRVPHVTMFHTMGEIKNRARAGEQESPLRVRTERRIVARVDRIVAPSPQEGQQVISVYGAPPGRVTVIPCGVDLETFRPLDRAAVRRTLGLPEGRLLLFVGRLEPLKGLDILLGVLPLLEEARLLVVGGDAQSGPELRRLQALARELGVTERVSFVGSVPHERLPLYYNAADVCVVPSYYESFGMVALEAMACGTPVVAARVGGLQSTVRDGETGFLIPWRCPEAYSERLEQLLRHDTLREHYARAARAAAQDFGWSAIADRVLALYDEVLAPAATPVATAR